ncbi:MAG: hypothetical protein CMO55_12185 [Verrucomicrobiales bacterium]|nr:hypothetical protein [Verrucomicrobiales bacterium]
MKDLTEVYKETHEHLRACDDKRNKLASIYAALIGVVLFRLDFTRIEVQGIIGPLIGLLC